MITLRAYTPQVHEQPTAGVGCINPPISAHFFSLELVAKLGQAQVNAGHVSDGAGVDNGFDVDELREVSPIVTAAAWHVQR